MMNKKGGVYKTTTRFDATNKIIYNNLLKWRVQCCYSDRSLCHWAKEEHTSFALAQKRTSVDVGSHGEYARFRKIVRLSE